MVSLVGALPNNTAVGNYDFRVAQRRITAPSVHQIFTQACNLVVVALGTTGGYFPVLATTKPTASTTSSSLVPVIETVIKPQTTTDIFVHTQYALRSNGSTDPCTHDIQLKKDGVEISNSIDYLKFIANNSHRCSGSASSLFKNLQGNNFYNIDFRHASNSGRNMTTSETYMAIWGLNRSSLSFVSPITVFATEGLMSASYPTLKEAFDDINSGLFRGEITIHVNDNTTETATAMINASGSGSASYTSILIYPTAANLTIGGSLNTQLIDLNGADNVTIDGRVNLIGEASLTLVNTSTNANAQVIRLINGAENNRFRYCNIKGSVNSITLGVMLFGSSNAATGNSGNIVEFCNFTNSSSARPWNMICSNGTGGKLNQNIIIRNNNFYNFLSPSSASYGINIISASDKWTIEGNSFYDTETLSPTGQFIYGAIRINVTDANDFIIRNNYIGGTAPQCGGSAWTIDETIGHVFRAIVVSVSNTPNQTQIENNVVRKFDHTSTNPNPFDGIYLFSGKANITGNMIGDTTGKGSITLRAPVAYLTATVSGGAVTAVNVIGGGSGYPSAPAITFSGGNGAGATAVAVINGIGEITNVIVTNGGSGYTAAPTVRLEGFGTVHSTFHGIWLNSNTDVEVKNNNVGSITTIGSDYFAYGIEGLYKTSNTSGLTLVENNKFGSKSTANSIIAASSAHNAATGQRVYGIFIAGNQSTIVLNNIVGNITNNYSGSNTASKTIGIFSTCPNTSILNNEVTHLTTLSKQTASGDNASLYGIGIVNPSAGSTNTISGNKVHHLFNNNTSESIHLYGIFYRGPTDQFNEISSNYIYHLQSESGNTSTAISGIWLFLGKTNCFNNIVDLGSNINFGHAIYGIWENSSSLSDVNIYFNTLLIQGSVSSGQTSSTYALWNQGNTVARNFRNNLLINNRSGGTTGKHYSIRINGTANLTINYNNYYAANATNNFLCYFTTDRTTLAAWQSATGQDANSYNADPVFANTGNGYELFYPTVLQSGATGTGVLVDFTGKNRSAAFPKIGALEKNEFVWTGASGTDYNTAANWTPQEVPGSGADIVFAENPLNLCILDQNRIVGKVINSSDKNLVLNGKSLKVLETLGFTGTGKIDGTAASSAIEFAGIAAQTIPAGVFVNAQIADLIVNNAFGVTMGGDLSVLTNLALSSGNLTIGTNTLTLSGTITQATGNLTGGTSSNMIVNGTGAGTTIPGIELNNLTLNRSNGLTMGGNLNVNGMLALTSGTLTTQGNKLTLSGSSPTGSGGVDASNSSATLEFANAVAMALPATFFAAPVQNLTLSGSGGVTASSDFTVNGILYLQQMNPSTSKGLLHTINGTVTSTLTMGPNATTVGTGDVTGYVRRTSFSPNVQYTFGNQFTSISFAPLENGANYPGQINVKIQIGNAPSWKTNAIQRIYDFVQTGGVNCFATIATHYLDSELNGNAESRLVHWTYGADGQQPAGAYEWGRSNHNYVDNWIEIANINIGYFPTSFGRLENTLSETELSFYTWNGSQSTSWTTPENWTPTGSPNAVSSIVIPDAILTPNDPVLPATAEHKTITIQAGGILNAGTNSVLTINGSMGAWSCIGGTFNPGNSTVIFTGNEATHAGNTQFHNLTVDEGKILTLTLQSHLKLSGSIILNGTLRTVVSGETTFEYNGLNQTVVIPNAATKRYYNLILSGSGSISMPSSLETLIGNLTVAGSAPVTLAHDLSIEGNLTIGDQSSFNTGNFDHVLKGNFDNDGTFTAASGKTFTFSGTANQIILGDEPITFTNLAINNAAHVSCFDNVTVNESLTLTSGQLNVQSNTLGINGTISRTSGFITVTPNSTLNFGGSAALTLNDHLFSATPEVKKLIVNRSGGVTFGNQNMTINETLTLTSGTLALNGRTLTMSGNNIARTSGQIDASVVSSTFVFASSNEQTISDGLFNENKLYNLVIDNEDGVIVNTGLMVDNNLTINSNKKLTIPPLKTLDVKNVLTNNAGEEGLLIQSNSTGTGSLIQSTAGVEATMQRYIPAAIWGVWDDGWHNLSSPVAAQAIYPGFVHGFELGTEDFYKWDEPTNTWINIKNAGGTGWSSGFETEFVIGRGYLVAYNSDVTKIFSGTLNVSDVAISGLTISGGKNRSWHLLGNPYSSALTWYTDWTTSNIGGVAKIWNGANKSYSDRSAGAAIPATNGFMVQVSQETGSLTIPAAKRTHSSQAFFKNSPGVNIMLTARNLNHPSAQESIICTNPAATKHFDLEFDSEFLAGFAPQFYSVAGVEKLSTNCLPELTEETVIPFDFIKNEGTNFSIEAAGIETLEPLATVFLKDKKLGISHNLSENPVYQFTSTQNDAPARFELHFSPVGIEELPSASQLHVYVEGNLLFVMNPANGKARVEVYNVQGQMMMKHEIAGGLQAMPMRLAPGTYLVRLIADQATKATKIVIQ